MVVDFLRLIGLHYSTRGMIISGKENRGAKSILAVMQGGSFGGLDIA